MRPITAFTPAMLAMVLRDWSQPELRAALACITEELSVRDDDDRNTGASAHVLEVAE